MSLVETPEYYSLKEAASMLGVQSSILRRQLAANRIAGRLAPSAFGVRWEVESQAVRDLLESGEFTSGLGEAESPEIGHRLPLLLGLLLSVLILVLLTIHDAGTKPQVLYTSLDVCRRNVQELTGALYRYAEVHHGHYPKRLSQLVPDHLSRLPHCPETRSDTYSAGYVTDEDHRRYKLQCAGHHHGNVVPSVGWTSYHHHR
jgi:hypothetical protein